MTKRSEFSRKTKTQAFLSCDGKCEHCCKKLIKGDINYDHITSDKILGDHGISSATADNIQVLCVNCHKIETRKDMDEIVKRRKQNKKMESAADGKVEVAFPPVKKKWASRKFDKKPKGYKHNWRK